MASLAPGACRCHRVTGSLCRGCCEGFLPCWSGSRAHSPLCPLGQLCFPVLLFAPQCTGFFLLLPPRLACPAPTPGVARIWGPTISTFSLIPGAEEAQLLDRVWAWLAGWSPVGRCRAKRGQSQPELGSNPDSASLGCVAAGEPPLRLCKASWRSDPGRTSKPCHLGASVRRQVALGQGRGSPEGVQVGPGRGRGGVLSTAQVPRADLGQGRDRCLHQMPSDKLTWSLSGGLNRGAEQLPRSGWTEPRVSRLRKEGPGGSAAALGH